MPKPAREREECSTQEEAFCLEYVRDFNGTRAATAAGYSKKSARRQSSTLLQRPHIKRRLKELQEQAFANANITRERTILEIARIAFADVSKAVYFDELGNLVVVPTDKVDADTRHAIASMGESVNKYGTSRRVTFHDKTKCLEMLSKYFGLDRVEQPTPGEGGTVVLQFSQAVPPQESR